MNTQAQKSETGADNTFARARALMLLKASKGLLGRWLGVTGGEHIFRVRDGRVFSVDLVLGKVSACVGLQPHEWRHPPHDEPRHVCNEFCQVCEERPGL